MDVESTISWRTERESLLFITDFILANRAAIEDELKPLGTVQHVRALHDHRKHL